MALLAQWRLFTDPTVAEVEERRGYFPLSTTGSPAISSTDGRLFVRASDLVQTPTVYAEGASSSSAYASLYAGTFTVSCWVKRTVKGSYPDFYECCVMHGVVPNALPAGNILFAVGFYSLNGMAFCHWEQGNGEPVFNDFSGGNSLVLPDGNFHHLAVRRTNELGGTVKLECFIDGTLTKTLTGCIAPTGGSAGGWKLSRYSRADGGTHGQLDGYLKDVRIYDTALSDADIAAIYAGTYVAISTFGVTYSKVREHHFPALSGDFSTTTSPKATTVTEMIEAEAAKLHGRLEAKNVTPSAIDLAPSTYPAAYAWCAETIRLGAALRAVRAMFNQDPSVAKAWAAELKERYDDLDKLGATALGDAPVPSEEANGPRWHGANHDLDTGDETEISTLIPRFRRDDEL